MNNLISSIFLFCFLINISLACDPDESTVVVTIHTDNWGYETAWRIVDQNGTIYHEVAFDTYVNNETYETEVCVPLGVCMSFVLDDSYGDGIFHEDGYELSVDGTVVAQGGPDFGFGISIDFNCPAGSACTSAIEITEGSYTTDYDNAWYIFIPDSVGIY